MEIISENKRIEELEDQLEQAIDLIAKLQAENQNLSEKLTLLINRLYRPRSERIPPEQLLLFDEAKGSPGDSKEQPPESQETQSASKRLPGHGRSGFPKNLPRRLERFELPGDERICDCCGKRMIEIGEDICEKGHFIPAQLLVRRIVRVKYACPQGHMIKTAPKPPALLEKGKYDSTVYAHVAVAKYADHIPLNRLSGIFKRYGIHLPKSTFWDMLVRVDELAAQPILRQMRKELLEEEIIQADETPVTLLLEDGKGTRQSYIWVYRSPKKILFDFTMNRGRDGPGLFLGTHWHGILQTDGYAGYDSVTRRNRLVRAGCWAHYPGLDVMSSFPL